MGTCDIALERVHALLKVDAGNGSLYNHLVQLARTLAEEKPKDALEQVEALSRRLKDSSFRASPAPEEAELSLAEKAAEEQQKKYAKGYMQLVRSPSDPTAAPPVLALVQNYLEDAAMFEWAGVGFGKQESYHLSMSLRKLAAETRGLESLRMWGKVLGTCGDYYVAEGQLTALATPPALPGSPDDDVEPRGQGANRCVYWITSGGFEPWKRLPHARASHVQAARSIKHMLSGELSKDVVSTPWFPGREEQLLRAQIARISSTCTLAPRGWYEVDEEAAVKNTLRVVEGASESFPAPEELATQGGWVHAAPFLLSTGKSGWPDLEALEGKISEEKAAEISAQAENEPEKPLLEGIEADLEELKPEDAETGPAWSIKTYGDEGVYASGDGTKTLRVSALRSMIWPGAITVVKGTRFANLYVGYGMKCGTLVGPEKESGLPLRGTLPLMTAPEDIMEEPADLEEHEEPNPIQDEAESDKGDVDEDPDDDEDQVSPSELPTPNPSERSETGTAALLEPSGG
eukprot:CAMPEP_0181441112 /NCGR_PEP_ID=MMETSP1110-20121109/23333_1 /TAXON_ID=174948 /ORGANISM="Symbiodinium sp., Strain CCMP421" /LENGTH=517 /DNA_ID=CAMNT_0023564973 /DNA_START=47 /DNA_END=1597 /DNA_ORIENTATION=+